MFKEIEELLKPQKNMDKYRVLMGFSGEEISRDGQYELVKHDFQFQRSRTRKYTEFYLGLFNLELDKIQITIKIKLSYHY